MLKYKKGKYRVINYRKYKGDPTGVVYRSGWEHEVMKWCDSNPKVRRWWSEEIAIPYKSPKDGKLHRYFPDFWWEIEQDGKIKRYLIEVKPKNKLEPPKNKRSKRYLQESIEYAVNQAKFERAREWAADHGCEFIVITERELKIRWTSKKPKR
tara:strand:- start:265 stop:723 length:459 start_codon:yes stop_codon:yes gene_type:complete